MLPTRGDGLDAPPYTHAIIYIVVQRDPTVREGGIQRDPAPVRSSSRLWRQETLRVSRQGSAVNLHISTSYLSFPLFPPPPPPPLRPPSSPFISLFIPPRRPFLTLRLAPRSPLGTPRRPKRRILGLSTNSSMPFLRASRRRVRLDGLCTVCTPTRAHAPPPPFARTTTTTTLHTHHNHNHNHNPLVIAQRPV